MMRKQPNVPRLALAAGLAVLGLAGALGADMHEGASWSVDEGHSEVHFTVNHFFTPVNGTFDEFEIDLQYDAENPEKSTVSATIPVGSINTRNERRDGHLKSEDFFEASEYPEITFVSTSVRAEGENRLIATGDLTIKGETEEIELPIEILGIKEIPAEMQQMLGGAEKVASFRATTEIDRGDFEVGVGNWAEDLIVGSDVEIDIRVEAHLK